MLYHPTFMLSARYFPIFSINISHKIRSTNELHRSSENQHPGVGKIVRFLRTLIKIYKITSRFKCIEANWALFKMIIFLFICFFVISYFFLLFISVLFILYFRFFQVRSYVPCIQVAMPCLQCHLLLKVIRSQCSRFFCFSNKKKASVVKNDFLSCI